MRKLTCPPEAETLGENLGAFADNLQGEQLRGVMEKHNLIDLDRSAWYPMRQLLDALNDVYETLNASTSFVAIGMKIGETIPLPPGMEDPTLVDILNMWDGMYQYLHRGADAGKITIEQVGPQHYKTIHTNPYPDDMSYGVLYGYARRFLPDGTMFRVYYDPDVPARDYGGTEDYTIIHVEWE